MNWKKLQNGSDIRGVALEGIEGEHVNLTPEVIETIAKSFVRWIRNNSDCEMPTIAVGMDCRLSGSSIKSAFVKGAVEAGANVVGFDEEIHGIDFFFEQRAFFSVGVNDVCFDGNHRAGSRFKSDVIFAIFFSDVGLYFFNRDGRIVFAVPSLGRCQIDNASVVEFGDVVGVEKEAVCTVAGCCHGSQPCVLRQEGRDPQHHPRCSCH